MNFCNPANLLASSTSVANAALKLVTISSTSFSSCQVVLRPITESSPLFPTHKALRLSLLALRAALPSGVIQDLLKAICFGDLPLAIQVCTSSCNIVLSTKSSMLSYIFCDQPFMSDDK